eukprot:scaffold4399_cov75-Skeletonema_dohrnii-CCMP3373.AAC.3
MSSVETLAPTLQLDEFEYLKGNLGWDVHYFLLFVVDVVIGSIAWGILVLSIISAAAGGGVGLNTVSSLDDEDLLLVIAVRTWLADAK